MERPLFLGLLFTLAGATCRPNVVTAEPDPTTLDRKFGEPKLAVSLKDPAINESSGLTRSHLFPGTYYTHNDSGDSARFWRFDLTGKIWGPFTLGDATAIDMEGAASARIDGHHYLYFADIGDNAERRESVQVFRVVEPGEDAKSSKVEKFELRYPDGPHNAEAFMVDPRDGAMLIVTKTTKSLPKVFRFVSANGSKSIQGELLGEVDLKGNMDPAKLVTGGDISADGRHLVLRTYVGAHEFAYDPRKKWWSSRSVPIQTAAEIQGEAIAYSADGKRLITSSEFSPCPISEIPIIESVRRP